jgi:hypothetical protein
MGHSYSPKIRCTVGKYLDTLSLGTVLFGFRYLSTTATLLFISYQIHNVVSWLKIKPFLPTWGSRLFIISLIVVQPFWIAEAWSNFEYFNNLGSEANVKTRPWEALFRDPWWLFTTWKLIDAIKKSYGFKLWALVRINSRFGVMLACMFISIAFLLTDVVVNALHITSASGINPYWRFALVFKCASDTIFLDDFKSVLDDIVARKFGGASGTIRGASIQGGRQHFIRDGYSFIEYGPETDMSPQPPMTTESKHFNPFHRRGNSTSTPKIHVHRDTTVTTEVRSASQDGYAHVPTLTIPAPAIYNHRQQNDGSRSLLIGRLSSDK